MKRNFEDIARDSIGRWLDIFRRLGIPVREDGKHGACPLCGGKDRARFDDLGGKGTTFCGQCGARDGFSMVKDFFKYDIKDAFKAVDEIVGNCTARAIPKEPSITPEMLNRMFSGSKPITEKCVVGKYLKTRGLSVFPDTLRYHPQCYESETKKKHHAMLGIIRLADGTCIGMHRTYLDADSNKLSIKSPKKITPLLKKNDGGAIRLFDGNGSGILAVAEGIETAIAFYQDSSIPAWSVISTSGMVAFQPPDGIKKIVVVSDNDSNYAGQKAAYSLANRLEVINKISVDVHVPVAVGDDWLDCVNRQSESA